MPFKKGQSGNPTGKPKGASNKVTKELRDVLKSIIEVEIEQIPVYLSKIKRPELKLKLISELLPYVLPKFSNISLNSAIERLPNDQLDELYNRIIQSQQNEKFS
jgi:hypothetical protein